MQDEIIWQGRPSWMKFLGTHRVSIAKTSYFVTSRKVIRKDGLVAKKTTEIEINDIRNIQVRQSIAQRIFRIGDILMSSSASNAWEVIFTSVKRPNEIKELISGQRIQG